ncbi:MAG: hypothetical protein Q9183_006984, partial [Haloplaca sp. 2 TL-2023]
MSTSSSSVLSSPPPSPPPVRRSKRKMGLEPDAPEPPKKTRKIQHQAAAKKTEPAAPGAVLRRSKRKMGFEPEFGLLPETKRVKKSNVLDEDGGKESVPGVMEKKKGKRTMKKGKGKKKVEKKEKTPDPGPAEAIEEGVPGKEKEKEKTPDAASEIGIGIGIQEEKAPEKSDDEKVQQWQDILKEGLNTSHAARAADPEYQAWETFEKMPLWQQHDDLRPYIDFTQIKTTENLWGDNVYLAIA